MKARDRSDVAKTRADLFTEFVREDGARIQQALMAALGPDIGRDAAGEAMAHAWQHWDRVRTMKNPAGYVFTVGRWPSARRFSNWRQTSSGSGDSPRPLRLRRMVASFCVATCTGKQLLPRAHFLHEYVRLPPARDIVSSIAIGPDDVARGDSRGVAGSSDGFADAASVPISASVVTE